MKSNRSKNPISKDKLMMTTGTIGGFGETMNAENTFLGSGNTFYMNKTNAIDDLSRENVIKHL